MSRMRVLLSVRRKGIRLYYIVKHKWIKRTRIRRRRRTATLAGFRTESHVKARQHLFDRRSGSYECFIRNSSKLVGDRSSANSGDNRVSFNGYRSRYRFSWPAEFGRRSDQHVFDQRATTTLSLYVWFRHAVSAVPTDGTILLSQFRSGLQQSLRRGH